MNWRRIFAVMAVRVSMIAAVLFTLMHIRAGALKEKEPKPAINTARIGVRYVEPYSYPNLFRLNHIHRLYFFPNEKREAEAEAKGFGNAIVLKKKMYIDGSLREEYEYDNKGNRIKYVSRGRNGDIAYEHVYEHNENGDVVKVCTYVDGSINESEECEYDKDGNCTKFTVYYWDGSIREWGEFKYDEMGNRTKEIIYRGAGTDNIYTWCEYEYDEKGNETKRMGGYSEEKSIFYQREYEYDEMGNVTKETDYNEYGMISSREEYEYDGMGNCISDIRYNGDGTVSSRYSYQYDEMGNRIKVIYSLKGSHIESWEEYEY
ncbi:MAG: RHS repeat protein, partial [Lachnospiraceae bacterium]|nr:RHS repeat protein [Lachnospiraceae bacterium]